MKKLILYLSTIAAMTFGGKAMAQPYEIYSDKKFDINCGRIVLEEHRNLEKGTVTKYYYDIQENCLKVPIFSVKEKVEVIRRNYKGYEIEIVKFDRGQNNINDVMLFKIRKTDLRRVSKGELVVNVLYEASDVTGKICNKLIDAFDMKKGRLGCDGTYDFKSLGNFPSKENPMQREMGQDLEELCNYLLKHKAKKIINRDIQLCQKRKKK
jgi:hypothetical protein